jgi:hypothetical protein
MIADSGGRPRKFIPWGKVLALRGRGVSLRRIARALCIPEATFFRHWRERGKGTATAPEQ